MISSVIPSAKYSSSALALMLANGSTATDCASRVAGRRAARLRDRSAATTSAPVANRVAGSFASSRTRWAHAADRHGGADAVTGRRRVEEPVRDQRLHRGAAERRLAGEHFVETQPRAKRSLRPSTASPAACSGLM